MKFTTALKKLANDVVLGRYIGKDEGESTRRLAFNQSGVIVEFKYSSSNTFEEAVETGIPVVITKELLKSKGWY